jgi:hypothetical protein
MQSQNIDHEIALMVNIIFDLAMSGSSDSENALHTFRTFTDPCYRGDHNYDFNRHCAAQVCYDCRDHKGMARCWCGWSASGGNGYAELIEMGETIEEDY